MSREYKSGESDDQDETLVTTEGQIITALDELTEVSDGPSEDIEDFDDEEDEDDRAGEL